eukprot:5262593-Pyramimonas_sp.AAC.1
MRGWRRLRGIQAWQHVRFQRHMCTAASSADPIGHRALRHGARAARCPRQRGALAAARSNVAPLRAQPRE